jgi:hypothetical protein
MDELCMWVTGFSKTIRILNTTDERRTYSGKRIIGVNGINIPVSNSDILNRCFISEHYTIPDGSDGKDSKIIGENEYLTKIRQEMPQILGYVFDILVKTLQMYEEVAREVKSNHRLADFVIWGETIARVLGYRKGEFLEAWKLNSETQNLAVIHNNSFAILVIKYVLNKKPEKEFCVEPDHLLKELKTYAYEIGIDYHDDKQLPKNAVWLTRKLNMVKSDLIPAGITIDSIKSDEMRLIWIKKNDKTRNEQQEKIKNIEEIDKQTEKLKKEFALDRFRKLLQEKQTDRVLQHDFQMDLTSSGKFFVGDALIIIETLVKENLLIKDRDGFLLLHSV